MDWLNYFARHLSKSDFLRLTRELRDQPKKAALLKEIYQSKNDGLDYEQLLRKLGYGANPSAFYTLKHRLARDLQKFRMQSGQNEIVKTESRIHNLRILLYSRDHKLLESEIRELKKKCTELELTLGRYEIYFCEYLMHYHAIARRKALQQQMEQAIKDETAYNLAELEFYRIIFEYQDVFYQGKLFNKQAKEQELAKITQQHNILNNNISKFLLLSAELTFELTLPIADEEKEHIAEKIAEVRRLYNQGNIRFRFPDCEFAIECLFNRYYLATHQIEHFKESLGQLEIMAQDIIGFKPYEDVLFYSLFARFWNMIRKNQGQLLADSIDAVLQHPAHENFSDKLHCYLIYLKGIAYLYQKKWSKAEGCFIRSRQFKSALDEPAYWLEWENLILHLSICFKLQDFVSANQLIATLKRSMKAKNRPGQAIKPFVMQAEQYLNNPLRVWIDYLAQLEAMQELTGLLPLLRINAVFV